MNAEEYDALYEQMLRKQVRYNALQTRLSRLGTDLEAIQQQLGYRTSLNELHLGVRTYNLLKAHGFSDVSSILSILYHGGLPVLMQIRGFGPKAWEELAAGLMRRQVLSREQVDQLNRDYQES